jgi:hypothetical protein
VEAGVERKKQTGFEDDAVVVASHEISVDVPVAVCGSLAAGLILNGKIVRGVFFFFWQYLGRWSFGCMGSIEQFFCAEGFWAYRFDFL